MIDRHSGLSLEVLDAVSRKKCQENTDQSSGEEFVQVDPKAHYMVRLSVVGPNDGRVFIMYLSVNDEYIGYRQCLSHNEGFWDVNLCSTMIGINEPIRFQKAKLLPTGYLAEVHSNILHMGKVTVKVYEGICDRRTSAFGNNCNGPSAYQPGNFLGSQTMHCCATPEAGHSFLTPVDAERLKKALLKRTPVPCDECQSFKRVKTETGYVHGAASMETTTGNGMDCDMVVHPRAWPLA